MSHSGVPAVSKSSLIVRDYDIVSNWLKYDKSQLFALYERFNVEAMQTESVKITDLLCYMIGTLSDLHSNWNTDIHQFLGITYEGRWLPCH